METIVTLSYGGGGLGPKMGELSGVGKFFAFVGMAAGELVAAPLGVGRGATVNVGLGTGVGSGVKLGSGGRGVGLGVGGGVGSGSGGTRGSGNPGSGAAARICVRFQFGPKGVLLSVASGLGVIVSVLPTPVCPCSVAFKITRLPILRPTAIAISKMSAPAIKTRPLRRF